MGKNNNHNIIADEFSTRIYDIELEHLFKNNKKYFLVDLDNTLVSWGLSDLSPRMAEWVRRVRAMGGDVCIVSNSGGKRRVRRIAGLLDVHAIWRARKPAPDAFVQGAELLGAETCQCVVVGDKLVTDIRGGKKAGMYTIHVMPLSDTNYIKGKIREIVLNVKNKIIKSSQENTDASDNRYS